MTFPAPTRQDHERFCRTEGWRPVRDGRGRTGTHHLTFELALPDGRVLRTRISHPPGRQTYGTAMWSHILRDQLGVDEAAFWACVRDGTVPDRGVPSPPDDSLPAEVVALLISRVGLREDEIATMSRKDAISRLERYWTESS